MTGPDADRIAALARNVARQWDVTPASLADPLAQGAQHYMGRAALIAVMREHKFTWQDVMRVVYVPPVVMAQVGRKRTVWSVTQHMRAMARNAQRDAIKSERRRARVDLIEGVKAARLVRLRAANEKRKAKRLAEMPPPKVMCGQWDDGARMREALAREGRDFSADAVPDDLDRGAPCYRVIAPNFVASVMREANC